MSLLFLRFDVTVKHRVTWVWVTTRSLPKCPHRRSASATARWSLCPPHLLHQICQDPGVYGKREGCRGQHTYRHTIISLLGKLQQKKKNRKVEGRKKGCCKKKKKMARERMSNSGCRITLFPRQETARPPPGVHSICPHTFFLMAYRKDALRIFLLHHPRHSSTELKSHRKLLSFTLQDKYSHFPCTSNVHTRY